MSARPCFNSTWCIDDLCQHADQGMCGLWFADTLPDDDDDMYPDDDPWHDEQDDDDG